MLCDPQMRAHLGQECVQRGGTCTVLVRGDEQGQTKVDALLANAFRCEKRAGVCTGSWTTDLVIFLRLSYESLFSEDD
jgi:hypothetical protein